MELTLEQFKNFIIENSDGKIISGFGNSKTESYTLNKPVYIFSYYINYDGSCGKSVECLNIKRLRYNETIDKIQYGDFIWYSGSLRWYEFKLKNNMHIFTDKQEAEEYCEQYYNDNISEAIKLTKKAIKEAESGIKCLQRTIKSREKLLKKLNKQLNKMTNNEYQK